MGKQTEGFIKMYSLYQFQVFHPGSKEHLSGAEWTALMYILERRLLYIRFDPKAVNGNTVRLDRTFKLRMFQDLGIGEKTYEAMITKLVHGGIFYRLARGWYMVNPHVFCRGKDIDIVRHLGVFRKSTLSMTPTKKRMPQFISTPTYDELVERIQLQNQAYRLIRKNMKSEEIQEAEKEDDFLLAGMSLDIFPEEKEPEPLTTQGGCIVRHPSGREERVPLRLQL